jgi:hypothetical protein
MVPGLLDKKDRLIASSSLFLNHVDVKQLINRLSVNQLPHAYAKYRSVTDLTKIRTSPLCKSVAIYHIYTSRFRRHRLRIRAGCGRRTAATPTRWPTMEAQERSTPDRAALAATVAAFNMNRISKWTLYDLSCCVLTYIWLVDTEF